MTESKLKEPAKAMEQEESIIIPKATTVTMKIVGEYTYIER